MTDEVTKDHSMPSVRRQLIQNHH